MTGSLSNLILTSKQTNKQTNKQTHFQTQLLRNEEQSFSLDKLYSSREHLMTQFIRYPFHNLSQERSMGAAYAAEISVLADLDRL